MRAGVGDDVQVGCMAAVRRVRGEGIRIELEKKKGRLEVKALSVSSRECKASCLCAGVGERWEREIVVIWDGETETGRTGMW